MKLFAGLSRTDYEDVFRAVGALIDERGWSNVSVMEVDDGLIVQVMIKPDQRETKPHLETYLLTDNDLERVLRDAVMRRQRKELGKQSEPPPPPPVSAPPTPSKMISGLLASRGAPAAPADWSTPAASSPSSGLAASPRDSSSDFSAVASQMAQLAQQPRERNSHLPILPTRPELPFPIPAAAPAEEDEAAPFAPAPMRLSHQPTENKIDTGVARAAVVMAHIVAARLKSGVPMTSDDPDLASLLEQVRALDEGNIGAKP